MRTVSAGFFNHYEQYEQQRIITCMNGNKHPASAGSVLLLSGGLDSYVSLAALKSDGRSVTALHFDYGQFARESERKAAIKQSRYFGVNIEFVRLDFWKRWVNSPLFTGEGIPRPESLEGKSAEESALSVWVPARNAVFVSIAASYAEAKGFGSVCLGCNSEEAVTFKDNSLGFVESAKRFLEYSTNSCVHIETPLIDMNKAEIVMLAKEMEVPLNLVWSCYRSGGIMCGLCESCQRLKRALGMTGGANLVSSMFMR